MALRGPSKSPRRQENTQVIVTKSSRHFSLPAWYLGPVPEGVHSLYRAGCCIHSDFSIAVEIQTKASVQKCFSLHGHPIFPREKTAVLMNLPLQIPFTLTKCPNPFSVARWHRKLIGTESLRKLRHSPLFDAQCQRGAKTVCSYSSILFHCNKKARLFLCFSGTHTLTHIHS